MRRSKWNFDVVERMLKEGQLPDEEARPQYYEPPREDMNGRTALIFASGLGHVDMARALLLHGANPNLNHGLVTPLTEACRKNYHEIAKLLLKYKANPNVNALTEASRRFDTPLKTLMLP